MSSDRDRSADPTPVPQDHVVFTDLDGVEGVLVDLDSKQYFQLNATASLIWRGVARGLGAARIAEELAAEYEVTLTQARASVDRTLRELLDQRLVSPPA